MQMRRHPALSAHGAPDPAQGEFQSSRREQRAASSIFLPEASSKLTNQLARLRPWNLLVYAICSIGLILRVGMEERVLGLDPAYQ
jgi:hypothetical protein